LPSPNRTQTYKLSVNPDIYRDSLYQLSYRGIISVANLVKVHDSLLTAGILMLFYKMSIIYLYIIGGCRCGAAVAGPVGVEELASWPVEAFVSMSAEIVPLSL